jgi:hypothetical protein
MSLPSLQTNFLHFKLIDAGPTSAAFSLRHKKPVFSSRARSCSLSTLAPAKPMFAKSSSGRQRPDPASFFSTNSRAWRRGGGTTAPASPTAWWISCWPSWTGWRDCKRGSWSSPPPQGQSSREKIFFANVFVLWFAQLDAKHRLNMEVDLSKVYLGSMWCAQLYSLAETPQPPPPALGPV